MPLGRAGWSRAAVALASALLLVSCTAGPLPLPQPSTVGSSSPSPATTSGPSATVAPPTTVQTSVLPTVGGPTVTAPRDVPAVVRLSWLGKRPELPGVTIAVPGGSRWQGTVPGEYAILSGRAYRWFGADGSAVACAAAGACIGFDDAGYQAVVKDGSTRLVYRPDGQPVGRFTADGRAIAGATLPPLAQQLSGTGLDLSALVDAASRPVPFAGGITGDPHVLTVGGLRYSTQQTGQYQARFGDPNRTVQVRMEPLPHQPNVSVVTAVAIQAHGSVLEYTAPGAVTLDRLVLPAPRPFEKRSIDGGPEIGLWASDDLGTSHAAMLWSDGSSVVMAANPDLGMTVVINAPPVAGVGGLFGVGSVQPSTDLQDRKGASPDPDTVVSDWLVRPSERLFNENVEPSTNFPAAQASVPAAAMPFAEEACRRAGLTGADDLAACEFDVGLTGDDGFASGHAAMERPANRRVSAELAARWPALVLGTLQGAQPVPDIVDIRVAAGEQRLYTVPVRSRGAVTLEFVSGCPDDEPEHPAADVPALRLFDAAGRPVADRVPACGKHDTPALDPGSYLLVIGGPTSGAARDVRLQVRAP